MAAKLSPIPISTPSQLTPPLPNAAVVVSILLVKKAESHSQSLQQHHTVSCGDISKLQLAWEL